MTDHINQSDGSRIEIDNSFTHVIQLIRIADNDSEYINIHRDSIPQLIEMLQNELKNTNDGK